MSPRAEPNSSTRITGKVTCAALFSAHISINVLVLELIFDIASGHRNYIAVGCPSGLYVAVRGESPFRKILPVPLPSSLVALQQFNKFLVQSDTSLLSYSLDLLARVARGETPVGTLEASKETIAGPGGDGSVLFFKVGVIGSRTLSELCYHYSTGHRLEVASHICHQKLLASYHTYFGGHQPLRTEYGFATWNSKSTLVPNFWWCEF
jgi:hypothetical protein